jgi:hypothetical protein
MVGFPGVPVWSEGLTSRVEQAFMPAAKLSEIRLEPLRTL